MVYFWNRGRNWWVISESYFLKNHICFSTFVGVGESLNQNFKICFASSLCIL